MNKTCELNANCLEEKKLLFTKNGLNIFDCNHCLLRFAEIKDLDNHIAKVYSDDYFFDGKAGYPNYLDEKNLLIKSGKQYAEIISKYSLAGNLLDVGCAAGFLMKGFEESGWHCEGIEPNDTMASYGRNQMHLEIRTGNLEDYTTDTKYDLISLIQVIGHFRDLNKALQNVTDMLNDRGFVLVEGWDMHSFIARFFGKRWHEYSPPSVIYWFSDETLTQLFNKIGLQLIAKGNPRKQINVKHAISLLEEKLPNFVFKKQLFNVIIKIAGKLNLNYPFNDLKWYLFRKEPNLSK